jgi:D-xylose transport system substrate-binding protein
MINIRIRLLVLCLLSVLVLGLGLGVAQAAQAGKPKVGFILATLQEERYQKDRRFFEEAVRKLGGEMVFASCNNSEQTQAAMVDNLISQGVRALVIQAVNGDTAGGFAKQAKADGVPVVAYDRLIKNAPIDAFVTEDAERVGEIQAEAAMKHLGGKGKLVVLMGQAGDPNAEARTSGIFKVLKKFPQAKVVAKAYHDAWSPERALKTTENALTQNHNDVQAILANNSGMARGALQALQEQKLLGKVFVAGADADLANVRDIVAGKQQFEVYISIQDMAELAAKTAMALAQKQDFKFQGLTDNGAVKVKTINTPVLGVDRASVEERVIRTGFHSRESVFGSVFGKSN